MTSSSKRERNPSVNSKNYLQEGNTLSESRMHPENGTGVSGLNDVMDMPNSRSEGNGKIPIALLLHHGQLESQGNVVPRVPGTADIHRTDVANILGANYGYQGMDSPRTVHVEMKHLANDAQEVRDDINAVGDQNIVDQYETETDDCTPAWVKAKPVEGYIKHPIAGYIMHPSFFNNSRVTDRDIIPEYVHDGEVDDPLCPAGKQCTHARVCFEVRVRMAVLSYLRHNISYRDAEHIWGVSRSTIQRRTAILKDPSPIIFLLTPTRTTN